MNTMNQNQGDTVDMKPVSLSFRAARDLSTRYKKECQSVLSANLSNKKENTGCPQCCVYTRQPETYDR